MSFRVHIEFKRVQTFLFEIPRMRSMVGANVALGEFIRNTLPKLCHDDQLAPVPKALLKKLHAALPNLSGYDHDPLATLNYPLADTPAKFFERGILSRDGGHFIALFKESAKAVSFIRSARQRAVKALPGVMMNASIEDLSKAGETNHTFDNPVTLSSSETLLEIPQLQLCSHTGNSPALSMDQATASAARQKDKDDPETLSYSAQLRQHAGDRFFQQKHQTQDILGCLKSQMPMLESNPARDLQQVCGNDYMAVIHADGNGLGQRAKDWVNKKLKSLAPQTHEEQNILEDGLFEGFYHSSRVAMRRAFITALHDKEHGLNDFNQGHYAPYQPLMLGGDDLLMVCRAKMALGFIQALATALLPLKLADDKKLSIGVGVAITSPNVPFHHLHHTAEELAGSAKRLFRGNAKEVSVIDWLVSTESWVDDPFRRRFQRGIVQYKTDTNQKPQTLLLNGRPYLILDSASANNQEWTLQSLLKAASELEGARSQLRSFVLELAKGKQWAELMWDELPDDTRNALQHAGRKQGLVGPWSGTDQAQRFWSVIPDLVELKEIGLLARNPVSSTNPREAAHVA